MTAAKWDEWGSDWKIGVQPTDGQPQLALDRVLIADAAWRKLSKRQREVMLSAAAGAPIVVRADVLRRLSSRGLIDAQHAAAGIAKLTDAGRLVVQWRLP